MSDKAILVWSWRQAICKSGLPSTTRHVLLTLSTYMNEHGEGCFPTTARLAADTGLSERTICTHIENATAKWWLEVKQHGFAGRKWKRHEYLPRLPRAFGLDKTGRSAIENADDEALKEVQYLNQQGTEPDARGTEPDDAKALNLTREALKEVQLSNTDNLILSKIDKNDDDEKLAKDARHLAARFYSIRQEVFAEPTMKTPTPSDVSAALNWLKIPAATSERVLQIVKARMQKMKMHGKPMPPHVGFLRVTVREELAKHAPATPATTDVAHATLPEAAAELRPALEALKSHFVKLRGAPVWQAWIAPMTASQRGKVWVFSHPRKFHCQHVAQQFLASLEAALKAEVLIEQSNH